jgi:membrane protein
MTHMGKNIGSSEVQTSPDGATLHRERFSTFRWRDIGALLEESFAGWNRHNAPRLGASLAFYMLLSLAPLLLVAVSIAGLVFGKQTAATDLVYRVQDLARQTGATTVEAGANALQALLAGARDSAQGVIATIFGLITLLFGASGVLIELHDALNTIWEVPPPTMTSSWERIVKLVRERLVSSALVLATGFLLVASLAVNAWIERLGAVYTASLPARGLILQTVNSALFFVIIAGLFAAIYKLLPDVHLEWRDVVLGGGVTSTLFTIGKLVIGLYLRRAGFASTYGAAASIVVFMLWVYYSSQIFFLGAEFTKIFATRYGSRSNRHPEGLDVSMAGKSPSGADRPIETGPSE